MTRALQFAHILLAIALTVAVGAMAWGACGFTRHLIIAVDRWGAAAPTAGKTDAVLDHINRPCKGASGPDACGTLAQINKTAIDAGDAIVTTQLQERAATPHVIAAMDTFRDAAVHLSGTADSLSGTATALTGTAQAATSTIGTAGTTIAAFQPVLGHLDASSADLDAFLKGKMLTKTLPDIAMNFDTATGNFAATTADVRSQVYKWTHPSKKKLTFWTATEAGGDYARHFMPSLF